MERTEDIFKTLMTESYQINADTKEQIQKAQRALSE